MNLRNKALAGTALSLALGGLVGLEGMSLPAYRDIAGVPTICAGTTAGVKMGDVATPAQCYSMTLKDYRRFEAIVLKHIDIPLNVSEQVALTYFCYNVGPACATSTAFKLFNQGRTREGCEAMGMWNKVTINGRKVVSKGLVNRRAAEIELCATPSLLYSYSPLLLD
ncbi:lysozyme [Pseudomonas phage phiNV3]|uniref:Lysozyme n=1 Tax=Pseudomonas phage phiNV3 TaxID=2079544 RepID=A0A2P0ZLK0_9CAUD|nr:lysozyme [Pseudomonas tolaasii]YP_009799024.1 lysozyme [Pseudomonas phage phiNV3]ARB30337.1 lysozyme [Pseudomonas tolaasii]AVH86153.1 putative lysozyme [Pseudomonas phage phiNV3]